ncbi:MAG: cation transporter, partial [Candidatus Kapaibacterium sp.]
MDFHVQQHYRVIGMSCAACAHSVTSLLSAQPGVVNATVNYGTQTAAIAFRSTQTSTQKLREGLQLFGYDILPQVPENEAEIERRDAARLQSLKRSAVIGSVLCVPLVVLGMDMQASSESLLVQGVLSWAVMLLCGRDFFVHAFQQARRKSVSMDTLVALSTG